MNIYQRIVLILGAVALIIVIWTTPKIEKYQGFYSESDIELLPFNFTIDYKTAIIRMTGVVGCTLFIFFAFKSKNK